VSLPSADVPSLSNSLALDMRGAVALLRLTRPEKRNALDDTTIAGIEAFFAQPPAGAGAVVLRAEGPHFYAGLDLSTITETDVVGGITPSRAWPRAIERIENGGMPVIAVLHGAVVGGGLELTVACHIRVAERTALPEGRHGIFMGGGGSVRLPRLIGLARMIDIMLTGCTYSADAVLQDRKSGKDAGFMMESLMAAIASSDEGAKVRLCSFLEGRASKVVREED
jgi:enoyl-CoA hydratase/carnithine racemase